MGVRAFEPALQPTITLVPGPCANPNGTQSLSGISLVIFKVLGSNTASPPWFFSSFQIGTSDLMRSMAKRAPSKASARCVIEGAVPAAA